MAELKITWTRSCIGRPRNQREIIRSLGLHRLQDTVVHQDSPTIRGMVRKVEHLLRVEELGGAA
jgi:large subunit ribosomal protein L30